MDKLVIAALADRGRYNNLIDSVSFDSFGVETGWLLRSFKKYFDTNPTSKTVDYDVLATMVRQKFPKDTSMPMLKILNAARSTDITQEQINNVVHIIGEQRFAGNLAKLINSYNDGAEIDLASAIKTEVMKAETSLLTHGKDLFDEPDIHQIIANQKLEQGLQHPLLCMREHIKPFVTKKNVVIAAPWDSGKTSFIAFLIAHYAPQCGELYPDRPIIWFNNEGSKEDIWTRVYCAVLGKTIQQIGTMTKKEVLDEYTEKVGGNRGIIKIEDIQGWTFQQKQAVIEEYNPCIVVNDMMANVVLAGDMPPHKKMETLFQLERDSATLLDYLAISTMQVSADGFDNFFPSGQHLKDTKVGAQGAMDLLLMMGRVDDEQYIAQRGLSTPKNKLKRVGMPSNFREYTTFDFDKCRFRDFTTAD